MDENEKESKLSRDSSRSGAGGEESLRELPEPLSGQTHLSPMATQRLSTELGLTNPTTPRSPRSSTQQLLGFEDGQGGATSQVGSLSAPLPGSNAKVKKRVKPTEEKPAARDSDPSLLATAARADSIGVRQASALAFEKLVAKRLVGRQPYGSGSGGEKWDVRSKHLLVSCKQTGQSTLDIINIAELSDLTKDAEVDGLHPVVAVDASRASQSYWVLIPMEVFIALHGIGDE